MDKKYKVGLIVTGALIVVVSIYLVYTILNLNGSVQGGFFKKEPVQENLTAEEKYNRIESELIKVVAILNQKDPAIYSDLNAFDDDFTADDWSYVDNKQMLQSHNVFDDFAPIIAKTIYKINFDKVITDEVGKKYLVTKETLDKYDSYFSHLADAYETYAVPDDSTEYYLVYQTGIDNFNYGEYNVVIRGINKSLGGFSAEIYLYKGEKVVSQDTLGLDYVDGHLVLGRLNLEYK